MSYYGKGFGRFGQYKSKKPSKKAKDILSEDQLVSVISRPRKFAKGFEKKPVKKQFKKLTDEEIVERGAAAKTESMIRRGYTPRGKDIQREVNNYLNNHPLRESNINEKGRKRFLEFRQAKINALKKEKKDG